MVIMAIPDVEISEMGIVFQPTFRA